MRTLVICHDGADLDRDVLPRWLATFSTYVGTVVIREPGGRLRRRIAREIGRVGWWRFIDVLAFRAWHALTARRRVRAWEARTLAALQRRYPRRPNAPELTVSSPNSRETRQFIETHAPDLVIARCKTLLKEEVFSIPRLGTFVMHPGICPEYRNAHGCFWALACGDADNVGMTVLRIDRGVDTGPVFGYFRVSPPPGESHAITQQRAVVDHLDAIRDLLLRIAAGNAQPIDTTGRRSAAWGQPWLSAHLRSARRRSLSDRSVRRQWSFGK